MKGSLFRLVLCALITGMLTARAAASDRVDFNFDQVELRLLVKLVGDLTGKRFVVDEKVNGKVTVVTPQRVPVEDVYPLLLSILESGGYSVVRRGEALQVVALPPRAVESAPVVTEGETAPSTGLITKVLRIRHLSAPELRKVLEPMVRGGKDGALAAFGPSNHLIVTDTAESIARIERILAEMDRPGSSRVVEVIPLEHASAEDVAAQLMIALKGIGDTAAGRVAQHMQKVAGGEGALPVDVSVTAAPQANSLIAVGPPAALEEVRAMVEKMDVEATSGYGRLHAVFLKYLGAEDAAKSLNALLEKTVEKDRRTRMAIEPSAPNNALIVDASPQDFQFVRRLIEELDQAPQQVLVEVLIAEVDMNHNFELGVEWATIDAPAEGRTTLYGRSRPGAEDSIAGVSEGAFPQGISVGIARGMMQMADGSLVPRIPFLLRALSDNRDVKILSQIPLWAQDNKEASVSVVNNIPVLRSTIEGGAGTARDIIQNIDRMDVGIKLVLTPHVNPDGEILLDLRPSIEAIVDEGEPGMYTPTIAKREVSTTVTVPNETTVVISGLIREDRVKRVYKVPLLGDIPLLGWLFRTTTDRKERTNLLIFVTPHIVSDPAEAERLKQKLQDQAGLNTTGERSDEPVER